MPLNLDGDVGRTWGFILVQAKLALRPVWGRGLYYPAPKCLQQGLQACCEGGNVSQASASYNE
jgi:hypothetical protein